MTLIHRIFEPPERAYRGGAWPTALMSAPSSCSSARSEAEAAPVLPALRCTDPCLRQRRLTRRAATPELAGVSAT
jgi:hypothetical protein